jgi:hypothetical protein
MIFNFKNRLSHWSQTIIPIGKKKVEDSILIPLAGLRVMPTEESKDSHVGDGIIILSDKLFNHIL